MINIFLEYEWLINLICMTTLTLSFFINNAKNNAINSLIGIMVIMSYSVLLLNVLLNSLVKGF